MPALSFSISRRRCVEVPLPEEAKVNVAGDLLGVFDHLLEGLHADRGMDDEAIDDVADAADRLEAPQRIVGVLRRLGSTASGALA